MAKTFNRVPTFVNGPRKSDAKNYTFDNYEFTGFKEDKNFLEVDQKSFAECENIYVNRDGLLKSRPAVKENFVFYELIRDWLEDAGESPNFEIKTINKIGNVYALEIDSTIASFILIYDDKIVYSGSYKFNAGTSYGSKIFCFVTDSNTTINKIVWYDMATDTSGSDNIYIPETEVQANSTVSKNESKNALTEKTKTVYLYVSDSFSVDLYGKEVTYEAFDTTFTFTFNQNTEHTILRTLSNVDRFKNYYWFSANGTFFVCNYIEDEHGVFQYIEGWVSYDGINFARLLNIYTFIGDLTEDVKMFNDGSGIMYWDDYGMYYYNFSEQVEVKFISSPNGIFHKCIFAGQNSSDIYSVYWDDVYYIRIAHYLNGTVFYNAYSDIFSGGLNDGIWRLELYKGSTLLYDNDYYHDPSHTSLQSKNGYLVLTEYNVYVENNLQLRIRVLPYSDNSDEYFTYSAYGFITSEEVKDIKLNSQYFSILSSGTSGCTVWNFDIGGSDSQYNYKHFSYGLSSSDNPLLYDSRDSFASNKGYQDVTLSRLPWLTTSSSGIYFDKVIYTNQNDVWALKTINGVKYLITSYFDEYSPIKLVSMNNGSNTIIVPEQIEQLSEYYFRAGDKLYISEYREDDNGNLLWYLPEINIEEFTDFVTLHPLSSTEMGVFTENGVYIVYKSTTEMNELYPYVQVKSKLDVKIRKGCQIVSNYDGTGLYVPTVRGLAYMTYQDFVQTTDQKLSFVSDTICDTFSAFNNGPMKLYKYLYWIYIYKEDSSEYYMFDIRNASWWPIKLGNKPIKKIIDYNDEPLLFCNAFNKIFSFHFGVDDYYDSDFQHIEWKLRSQPLYLGAANYYKHIQNITFMNHIEGNNTDNGGYEMKINLTNTAFRSKTDMDNDKKFWKYDIQFIRSYVLRLNYPKVCEFEYLLESSKDIDDYRQTPLSLSNITIKYRMGGQIR